jgi:hypothetical protein
MPSDLQPSSVNGDFAAISKVMYKWVQIRHHQANWNQLPKSLEHRIGKLVADIKPPSADDDFRSSLTSLASEFGDKIRNLVYRHLQSRLIDTEFQAGSLDPTDLDRAKQVAAKYINIRLGKRLEASKRDSLLSSAANLVGINRRPPSPADTYGADDWQVVTSPRGRKSATTRKRPAPTTHEAEPNSTPTDNRFVALINVEADDPEKTVMGASHMSPPPPSQRNSPQLPTPKKHCPSHDVMKTTSGVTLFTGAKDKWTIEVPDDTQFVMVGDSNLRAITQVPPRWQVHSLPGAHINHVARVLGSLRTTANRRVDVIIQAGINNRNESLDNNKFEIDFLLHEARGNDNINRIFYSGVSYSNALPEAICVRDLNKQIVTAVGHDGYILPLDPKEVKINPTDHYGIHYTPETADRIMASAYRHIMGKVF